MPKQVELESRFQYTPGVLLPARAALPLLLGWLTSAGGSLLLGCGGQGLPEPTRADIIAAEPYAHGVSLADLNAGRSLYIDRCSSCHRLAAPSEHPAARWAGFVQEMQKQAALTDIQERQIVAYLQVMSQSTLAQ